MTVGFYVLDDNATGTFAAAGFAVSTGSQRSQATAIVKDLNAHGGLFGRKVVPAFAYYSLTGDASTQDQRACAAFADDHHATFVISGLNSSELIGQCLAKRGIPFVNDNYLVDARAAQSMGGLLFSPSGILLDRMMANIIDQAARRGFITKGTKVGILSTDGPSYSRVLEKVVLPRLAAHGITNPTVVSSGSDAAGASNQQGSVVKFRSDGVTRVFSMGNSPLPFMLAAESQGYHPRYALYSQLGPGALLQSAAPRAQLTGAIALGWSPHYDVDASHSPGPVSPAETKCLNLMKAAGEDTTSATTAALVLWFCDAAWFVRDAVTAAGDVSPAGLIRGAGLIPAFQSAATFRVDVTAARPDGMASYRDLAFVDSCGCFQYAGPLRSLS